MLVRSLPLADLIIDAEWNCRSRFYPPSVVELAECMKAYKQLMPVLTVQEGDRYRLVAGFRRCAAAKLLGWTEIHAVVSDLSPEVARRVNICENIERRDLSLWEEANALRLMYPEGAPAYKIANEVKRTTNWVQRRLKLLNLEEPIQRAADSGRITEGDLERIVQLSTSKARNDLLQKLLSEAAVDVKPKSTVRTPTAIRDMTVKLIGMGVSGDVLDALLWVEKQLTDDELIERVNHGLPTKPMECTDQ